MTRKKKYMNIISQQKDTNRYHRERWAIYKNTPAGKLALKRKREALRKKRGKA